MASMKRALICANPDLNYIDGSSVWAQTITLVLAATGSVSVDFIAKSTPQRDELFRPLVQNPNVHIIDGLRERGLNRLLFSRLDQRGMADVANELDQQNDYDFVIVRGYEIAKALLRSPELLRKSWVYLTDIPQNADEYETVQRIEISRIALGCDRLLCQTAGFEQLWKTLVPDLPDDKCYLYQPVILDTNHDLQPISRRQKLAIYAGKFTPDWMTLEMAESWSEVGHDCPGAELHMIGDKIDAASPSFYTRMKNALQKTPALKWRGAMAREEVQEQLRQARVGLSWRASSMDSTLEYSTKILEYGANGCAAILNRNPLHEELLGRDYPLFANTREEYLRAIKTALEDDEVTQAAADKLIQVAQAHTFGSRVKRVSHWVDTMPESAKGSRPGRQRKLRVLVAGHDLKFFKPLQKKLEETGRFEFLIDQWQGHDDHDEAKSLELLPQADVIFCEWCLGNLNWYSRKRLPHQRLVARFHAQEVRLPYMEKANWNMIHHVSFVSEHTRRQALEVIHEFPVEKTSVIPNFLDDTKFTPKRKTGEARFTLGVLGAAPKSKRLDRAIDLLEVLLEEDSRYCLRVKGKNPLDYGWLLKRPEELAYYRQVFERINNNPRLRHRVLFDPPGDDVNDWFTMVGFILSPSDHESFHMAIGEGLLTGATPIIWDWEGAEDIWGRELVVSSLTDAKQVVLSGMRKPEIAAGVMRAMSSEDISGRWLKLIDNGS